MGKSVNQSIKEITVNFNVCRGNNCIITITSDSYKVRELRQVYPVLTVEQ